MLPGETDLHEHMSRTHCELLTDRVLGSRLPGTESTPEPQQRQYHQVALTVGQLPEWSKFIRKKNTCHLCSNPMRETLFLFPHDTDEDPVTAVVIGSGSPRERPSRGLNQAFPSQSVDSSTLFCTAWQ